MELELEMKTRGYELSEVERKRIQRQIDSLAKRLEKFPAPRIDLVVEPHSQPRRFRAGLRVALGTHDAYLISHQEAGTPDVAVKHAVEDVKRQLERHLSDLRRDAAYGVPSRREPSELRPKPPRGGVSGEEADEFEDYEAEVEGVDFDGERIA